MNDPRDSFYIHHLHAHGKYDCTTVRILLDGGSSDNFIQMEKIPKRKSQSNRWVNNE
ncbi:unnamed protein product [Sphenostylis stenocarpa]|uniref:Uncharacterized protein n=1 Tax=Sphenostylis stenocarpa TaxID=92480 RepID=A0AA86SU68_9FABA|nr:unnamed protein product [Sphenostylis stenocarpa]